MEESKPKSKFASATGTTDADLVDPVEFEQNFTPRVIYTRDAKVDMSNLQVAQLRVANGMTAEVADRKANVGQFVLSNFGPKDEVVLVPFNAQKVRALKPDPKKPPTCSAPMGEIGFGEYGVGSDKHPSGVCKDCPMAQWGPKNPATGRSSKPPCTEAISMRAYSITHRSLVDFLFTGARAQKGVFVQQQAMAYGYGGFAIRLTSVPAKNDKGQWFDPEVEMLGDVPEDQREISDKWFMLFSETLQTSEEAAAALTAGG